MDPEDLRSLLSASGVDLWALIEGAISVAARDHADDLKARRDGIVERLFAPAPSPGCRNCSPDGVPARDRGRSNGREEEKDSSSPAAAPGAKPPPRRSPPTPQSMKREDQMEQEQEQEQEQDEEEEDEEEERNSVEDQKSKILAIKEFLDDEDQSDDSLASLLQNLADMDLSFKALKETDIGRHVNGLRKHPSGDVRRLVKLLVRKWKEIVDEWVKSNSSNENASPANIMDGDSPPQQQVHGKSNGHMAPDFGYSPNPHRDGSMEPMESKRKVVSARREAPPAPQPMRNSASAAKVREHHQQDGATDSEKLASARRRLQENYQEAQNAKKQRTIQVMDINEIPRSKNTFLSRGKGGGGGGGGGGGSHQAKRW